MRLVMRNYFQLADSFIGDMYFEVSKHLGKPVSWVIKHKFTPDVKFLIFKYAQILRNRKKEYDKIQNESSSF